MSRPSGELPSARDGSGRRWGHLCWIAVAAVAVAALVWVASGGPGSRRGAGGGTRRPPPARKMYVVGEDAQVRARPSASSESLGRLEHRARVSADSTRGGWTRVAHGDGWGWVRGELLFRGDPPPCEISSWGFSGTTVAGTLQNCTDEPIEDLRLRIIYYNDIGQIVNASLVRLPDVPPASARPEMGKVSFRTTTAPMGTERDVRLIFGRLRPMTVTVDWTLEHETGVWWYSGIEQPKTSTGESSADIARRVLEELSKESE